MSYEPYLYEGEPTIPAGQTCAAWHREHFRRQPSVAQRVRVRVRAWHRRHPTPWHCHHGLDL